MYTYSVSEWLLFFFWYCFLGWIWECSYVSVKQAIKKKKWEFVNRGFLNGPFIPIYGFAAVAILLATIRFRDNIVAVYIVGALTATIFELVTGTTMERLFKVKYWDYSDMPLNYEGHISLVVSLFWGFLSVLLVKVIHVPVENILLSVSSVLCNIVALVLLALFVWDTIESFNEAMELKDIIESITENNELINRIERRYDAIVAFTLVSDIEDLRDLRLEARESINYRVEKMRWKATEHLEWLKEKMEFPELEEVSELNELLEKLEKYANRIKEKTAKQYLKASRQLKRNPSFKSKRYQETVDYLYELLKNRD